MLPTGDFSFKDIHRLRVKGRKKSFQATSNQKKAGGAILTSDKIDFKLKMVKSDKKVII